MLNLFFLFLFIPLFSSTPVSYNGRFIPDSVYSQLEKQNQFSNQDEYLKGYLHFKEQNIPPKEIEKILETHFPITDQLRAAGPFWKVLPSRFKSGEWVSLQAINIRIYDSNTDQLIPLGNFTLYPDEDFNQIKHTYEEWENTKKEETWNQLLNYLEKAYEKTLAGKPYQQAYDKALYYPTLKQLKMESLYFNFPFLKWAIFLYGLSTLAFGVKWKINTPLLKYLCYGLLGSAFILHTLILAMRCYILARPPVSNMFETLLYVPWVGVGISLLFHRISSKHPAILMTASFSSLILLMILFLSGLNNQLENVQPVLDSQFWLIIHVLMVVGSYGIFILGGLLGHFYLIHSLIHKKETDSLKGIGQSIVQSLYLGTFLLVSGTILGGVWAATSWGRFWDWDPKESWAFISICVYLIIIHLYRFQKIDLFGLAVGSIVGLLAISFTWYGVNYILGTGLHSYGFGTGGQYYYYSYLLVEILFLAYVWIESKQISKSQNLI